MSEEAKLPVFDAPDYPNELVESGSCNQLIRANPERRKEIMDLFFETGVGSGKIKEGSARSEPYAEALAICAECPVKAECLAYALGCENDLHYGVYGGTTPEQRAALASGGAGEALCAYCNLPFERRNRTQRYCSEHCRKAGRREDEKVPGTNRHYKTVHRLCVGCGKDFEATSANGRPRRYCTDQCYETSRSAKRAGYSREQYMRERTPCEKCGYPCKKGAKLCAPCFRTEQYEESWWNHGRFS